MNAFGDLRRKSIATSGILVVAIALMCGLAPMPAYAQGEGGAPGAGPGGPGGGGGGRGFGGPPMAPEDQEAVWKLQAGGVAKGLELNAELTDKLAAAYADARKSQQAELQKAMEGAEPGPGSREANQKVNDAEREKLKTALAAILNEEQTTKALASLGTFSRQWDRLVLVLKGFGLDDEKQAKGLSVIETSIVESDAAVAKARESGDREAIMAAMQESRTKLDTAMAEVLDESQMAKWKASTSMRGGGRGGFGGGRGGGATRREEGGITGGDGGGQPAPSNP